VEKAIGSQLSLDEAQLNYSPIEGREAGAFRKTKEDKANEKAKHFASLLVCLLRITTLSVFSVNDLL